MFQLKQQPRLKPRTLFSRSQCFKQHSKHRHRVVKLSNRTSPTSTATSTEPMETGMETGMGMGIGIDIASVERIKQLIDRYDRETLNLLFTTEEIDRCQSATRPYQNFAICFATKEAVGKALGTGLAGIDWHEIEAIVSEFQLNIRLYGKAKLQAAKLGYTQWIASWSSCNDYVLVHVLAS